MKALPLEPDLGVEIVEIGHAMNLAGLPKEFVASAVHMAFEFEGVYDLIKLWAEEQDPIEREELVIDIQEMIDDYSENNLSTPIYVRFDDLDTIAKNIRAFKDQLRIIVDQKGGIKHLSELSGVPQPSLSRLFNSSTMPRRNTLNKIRHALKLNQVQLSTQWSH